MAAGLPTSVITAIEFTAGVWTDVSTSVRGDSIEIHVGREPGTDIQPGTLSLQLDNSTGAFTPDNPTSTYYPKFVEGKRIRVQVVKSATTYTRFVGRITSLEPDFPTEPSQALTTVTAVDGIGDMARMVLPSYPETAARRNPSGAAAFWKLSQPNEHTSMVDSLDVGERLRVYDRIPGTGSIDAASDETLGDGAAYVKLHYGKGLWHPSIGVPSSVYSGGVWIAVLVNVTSSSYGEVLAIGNYRRDNINQLARVRWTSTGFIMENYVAGALVASTSAIPAADGWHHLFIQAGDGVGDSIMVDDDVSDFPAVPLTGSMRFLSLGGDIDMSVANLLVANSSTAEYYLAQSVLPGITASSLNDAASDLAIAIDTLGSFNVLPGYSTAAFAYERSPLVMEGRTALDVLKVLADSQSGIAYANPTTFATQDVNIVANVDARPSTVALTIDAEGDLSEGPTMSRSIDGRIASATATNGLESITVQDSTITDVGSSTVDIETALGAINDLRAVASDRIARGRDKRLRPASVAVDLATASNDLYASFFALTPGERVRLSGLPSTYFGVTYVDGYVEGWTERPGVTGYEVTFDLSPADAPPEAKADDSTYGRAPWGTGVCTLTSSITSSATSVSLTFTGSTLLSTSAGDYPLDIDVNGERMTISSAPAGGSSPRTVTVTRGVAPTVARAHSAGEAVDIWLGARAAL